MPSPEADRLYDALPESRGGKVIGTDIARNLHPGYAAGREGKIRHTQDTNAPAADYARDRLEREIDQPGNRRKLMLMAGGWGSGKTSVVTDETINENDLVYDGALTDAAWATRMIERALANGWDVRIHYVQRPLDLTVKGVVERAQNEGRWLPVNRLPEVHRAAQESVLQIARRFEGDARVELQFWLNAGTRADPKPPLELDRKDIDVGGKYSYVEADVDKAGNRGVGRPDGRGDRGDIPSDRAETGQTSPVDQAGTRRVERPVERSDAEGIPSDRAGAVHRAFAEAVRDQLADPGLLSLLAQGSPALERLIPGAINRPSRRRMP